MKADFTRDAFNLSKHFSRVLMQQGRVQLDSDWNEQVSILLHYLRAFAADLIGPYGGPGDAFKIGPRGSAAGGGTPLPGFNISPGHYYVHGILCENSKSLPYTGQPHTDLPTQEGGYLIYLDVWERLISYVEDDSILDVALGGVDTAARAKVEWQVKSIHISPGGPTDPKILLGGLEQTNPALLRAQARTDQTSDDPCSISPEAHYRGFENQLYRVEIHTGENRDNRPVTFKWSRDNGSVVFPIRALQGGMVSLDGLGRDSRMSLSVDDWVEITDDEDILRGRPGKLFQIASVDLMEATVSLKRRGNESPQAYDEATAQQKRALLRRWDYKWAGQRRSGVDLADDGALKVKPGEWIDLEDGVQIKFEVGGLAPINVPIVGDEPPSQARAGGGEIVVEGDGDENRVPQSGKLNLKTGDYWLIPARTASGDVEWPGPPGNPDAVAPQGVKHYYAPLAKLTLTNQGIVVGDSIQDLRCSFKSLCELQSNL